MLQLYHFLLRAQEICHTLQYMSYQTNQKSDRIQSATGEFRKITGLWKKVNKEGKFLLKSGRINTRGWENCQAFGDRTILLILPNQKTHKRGKPDYWLIAVEDKSLL
jgi:hypothetical protein